MNLPPNGSVPGAGAAPTIPTIGIRLLWKVAVAQAPNGQPIVQFVEPQHSFDNFGPALTPEVLHQAIAMLGQAIQELSNMETGLRAQQNPSGGIQIVKENQLPPGLDLRGTILKRQ